MTLYDRILVPTDGSAEGERAVAHALDLAAVHGAAVHAIHVVDSARYAGMPMEASWEGVGELLRGDADEAVDAVEGLAAGTDVDVETAVVEGSPSREIVRYAEGNDCDLVVMGTHGRGGIDRLLLGSVAEKVVRGSAVPVLTVRIDGDDPPEPATAESAGEETTPGEASTDDAESEATGRT
ncbi:universal stress protein [Halorubrum sp. SD626R]|jgi:nucleotide-binding universal stress UspA family protein|uniref:universal stress protein n=1 Tax=Halorubrum sp. SD626R TaxID=1419722 RepID=UPI000B8232FE|nr:universal stress protein [Halorubrum sp. SD626R]TKX79473.1 universal stress protein [Halorubrum sp. SD626R]